MRFISKNSNLRIILKPGMPASPLTGTLAVPSVFVKFQNGEVYVENEELIQKMKLHSGYNADFISVEDDAKDPFSANRSEVEPAHNITEIKYGHTEKKYGTPQKVKLSPEMQALIQQEAMRIAKEMIPSVIASLQTAKETPSQSVPVKELTEDIEPIVTSTKPGRPAKK